MYDLLIKDAKVIDGSGACWYRGSVGVEKGRIVHIGLSAPAREIIDADGLYLAPGFIDIHSHSDTTALIYPENESRILQGITSEIAGNCGISPSPTRRGESGVREFLQRLEQTGCSTNLGILAGHGTLRAAVMGYGCEAASPEQLKAMQALAAKAMEEGAFGLSSGLIYPPGCYSDENEMTAVVSSVAPYGGYYATHMRNEGVNVVPAVAEALETAKKAGVRLQISHHKVTYKPDWQVSCFTTVAMIARARRSGQDVCCDQYPYRASSTVLSINIPVWGFNGGTSALMSRLQDPSVRERLKNECNKNHEGRWGDIFIAYVTTEKNRWMNGLSIPEIAARLGGKDPAETLFDIVIEENDGVGEICYGMCEADIEYIMRQDFTMTGSDGNALPLSYVGKPHPRYFGTFVRVLGHYCRDRQLFPLEAAVRKLTSMPAARAGLTDRGVIKRGMRADLVLFDFDALEDTPTYECAQVPCRGIERVYVGGVLTALRGKHTGAMAGQPLYGPGYHE